MEEELSFSFETLGKQRIWTRIGSVNLKDRLGSNSQMENIEKVPSLMETVLGGEDRNRVRKKGNDSSRCRSGSSAKKDDLQANWRSGW